MENQDNIGSKHSTEEDAEKDFPSAGRAKEGIKSFFSELLNIKDDTDRESTIEAVKKDISFKGHNAWILVFSIFVASIGLNLSSTAVVIGAMLISPLMGPIVGVGLSVAINDVETLRKSFVNLGVMIGLSVLTAFIYFSISPVKEETPELIARTYPTILDVLLAIFGGLALIVAKTKRGTIASVIFGVAIATALMPPLCTVGYGLAIGNFAYAGGALYLFSINAVFIALSSFLVVKILGFPLVKYANSRKRRRIAQIATTIAVVVMVPSVILFINLLQKQVYESKAREFFSEVVKFNGAETIKFIHNYENQELEVFLIGATVPQSAIENWRQHLGEVEALKESSFTVHQGSTGIDDMALLSTRLRSGVLEDLYVKNQEVIENKDAKISLLENELMKYRNGVFSFRQISEEVKVNYQNVSSLSYANIISTDFSKIDTIPTFIINWKSNTTQRVKNSETEKIQKWLDVRLELDTVAVRSLN